MRSNPKRKQRGNVYDRHSRKRWLLSPESGFGGNGSHVMCVHGCGTRLDYKTVESDRIKPGGTYARLNIQPACRACNARRGNNVKWVFVGGVAV